MVAAWIRAETGVGPAMASGSQTCRGTWADLPIAPQNSRIAAQVSVPRATPPDATTDVMWAMLNEPAAQNSTKMPNMKPTSPMRVVMNAFMAAFELARSSCQWPMRRYEATPTPSQPISICIRLLAMTRLSIEPVNSDRQAWYQV